LSLSTTSSISMTTINIKLKLQNYQIINTNAGGREPPDSQTTSILRSAKTGL
jgi:hypothetical protein